MIRQPPRLTLFPSPPFSRSLLRGYRRYLHLRPMTTPRVAVYPGSFDPITRGHEDLIRRALTFTDRVVVAVAVNTAKQPLFTLAERVALIKQAVSDPKVDVRSFEGLLADFARAAGAPVVALRLRAGGLLAPEVLMALMYPNRAPRIATEFPGPPPSLP